MLVNTMDVHMQLKTEDTLPKDQDSACLIGRAWVPGNPEGPSPVWLDDEKVYDLATYYPTISQLLEKDDPAMIIRSLSGLQYIGSLEEILQNTHPENQQYLDFGDALLISKTKKDR